jgi:hypothetical protein
MPKWLTRKRGRRRTDQDQRTTISFSRDDLRTLSHVVAVGAAVLQVKHPVVARLKAALSRLGVPVPQGL